MCFVLFESFICENFVEYGTLECELSKSNVY